ncbi:MULTISPECIES: phosphoribosylformylglycinamidine cyclo-ligase [Jeotgalicoccus]|uniref:phosphoribosylformylglycinamidine cyclo-ligase n=1 Tax=Jeotgalicoccus TaxID=227979 RepID=UPI000404AD1C|nr:MULTISPECIES: phosphoribosylformylglycinamidine cyclo-ligase [Jeotgalicoccus]QQD84995.1 phosphoribosylformylglycinamidine cyclo-ligase [Jeotgalicoccus sp. ATCC 8456]
MSKQYKNAGVDIEAGYEAVEQMKRHVRKTLRPEVIGGIGGFGAVFDLSTLNLQQPVLVSGTDGVGTKLKLAIDHNRHDTIGIDAVAMCVNDIITTGAEPLYFLDYIAVNKVVPEHVAEVVKGISEGCKQSDCALIGGETAEMGEMYAKGEYDLAGFAVGAVEKEQYIDGSTVKSGDKVIGLTSSGIHSNGYSLVRKILVDHNIDVNDELDGDKLLDLLIEPTRIYTKAVKKVKDKINIKAMSHITGGGFYENIPRAIPDHLGVDINTKDIQTPKIISWLIEISGLDKKEAYNVFNMGIGFIMIVDKDDVDETLSLLKEVNYEATMIGEITSQEGLVIND